VTAAPVHAEWSGGGVSCRALQRSAAPWGCRPQRARGPRRASRWRASGRGPRRAAPLYEDRGSGGRDEAPLPARPHHAVRQRRLAAPPLPVAAPRRRRQGEPCVRKRKFRRFPSRTLPPTGWAIAAPQATSVTASPLRLCRRVSEAARCRRERGRGRLGRGKGADRDLDAGAAGARHRRPPQRDPPPVPAPRAPVRPARTRAGGGACHLAQTPEWSEAHLTTQSRSSVNAAPPTDREHSLHSENSSLSISNALLTSGITQMLTV
jgi:hypothetical protein